MNEPAPRCDRDGMRPIARSQLVQNVFEMNLHGMLGQKEPVADIAIPISFLDVRQNVELAIRELFIAEMLDQTSSDLGQDTLFSVTIYLTNQTICRKIVSWRYHPPFKKRLFTSPIQRIAIAF
jgi:hypothetical protein